MKIKFEYAVTNDVLNQEFVTSIVSPLYRSVTFSLSELSEQARKDLLALSNIKIQSNTNPNINDSPWESPWDCGRPKDKVSVQLIEFSTTKGCECLHIEKCTTHYDHAVLTISEVESKLAQMLEQVTAAKSECKKHNEEVLRERAEQKANADAEKERIRIAQKEASEKNNAALKEREILLEEEGRIWIPQNGSERLRLAHLGGYECIRLYVSERAQFEYPNFILDLNDYAEWEEQKNPSLPSLQLEKELHDGGKEAEIVRVKRMLNGSRPDGGCEAVVIRNFLGAYNLIKLM